MTQLVLNINEESATHQQVSKHNLKCFFDEKCTLLQLINENPFVYFADLDIEQRPIHLMLTSTDNIPSDYLPSEKSFFKAKQYEKYAFELKDSLLSNIVQ